MKTRRIDNGLIFQQGQAMDRSRQVGVRKPEVGQQYRTSGRQRSNNPEVGKGTGRQAGSGSGAGRVVRKAKKRVTGKNRS